MHGGPVSQFMIHLANISAVAVCRAAD